jgi:hypothetical protein
MIMIYKSRSQGSKCLQRMNIPERKVTRSILGSSWFSNNTAAGILPSIRNPGNTPERHCQILEEQTNFLQRATAAHQTMIVRVFESEHISETFHTDPRRDLWFEIMVLEYMLRGFSNISTIWQTSHTLPSMGGTLYKEAISLEFCRMRLCSPDGNGTKDQVELDEVTVFQRA